MSVQSKRIAERRRALDMSQEDLAGVVNTHQRQISRYETGQNDPTADVLVALAQALNTSTDWLVGLTDNPERPLRGITDLDEIEREVITILRSVPITEKRKAPQILRAVWQQTKAAKN
jgi:transcriptional regulator with XRE-family HTH domain